jgi:hypothetical protein
MNTNTHNIDASDTSQKANGEQYRDYPEFIGSWDDKTYSEALKRTSKNFAWYHKPTKLWVYFLPNYEERQIIALGLKNNATVFEKNKVKYFTELLKSCSFNGTKEYAKSNFLEFECKSV